MTEYSELLELMRSRRSVRQFADRAVKREDVLRVLEAARWAPSNHNRQPWKFMVLEDGVAIRGLAECIREHLSAKLKGLPSIPADYALEMVEYATFFGEAPVLLVALHKRPISAAAAVLEGVTNPELVSGEPLSVAMAVQNMLLAAHALGLGTCVLTGPLLVEKVILERLKIPAGLELNCLIALGYSDVKSEAPRRKDLQQILEFH